MKIILEKCVQVGKEFFQRNNYGLYEPVAKEDIVAARGHSALTLIKKLKELDGELVVPGPTLFNPSPEETEAAAKRLAAQSLGNVPPANGEPENAATVPLIKLTRPVLNAMAKEIGIENAEELPNKQAVVSAIETARKK